MRQNICDFESEIRLFGLVVLLNQELRDYCFVKLSLDKPCKQTDSELDLVLHPVGVENGLDFFVVVVFPFLHQVNQRVQQVVYFLVEFLLCGLVFNHVWVLVQESVVLNLKLLQNNEFFIVSL